MTRIERLREWAETVPQDKIHDLLAELVDFAVTAEMVCFWDDTLAPYWDGDGEPLVEGQKTYDD